MNGGNPVFWASIIGFTLFAGIISGSYPAFYLSSFNPVKVLKGTFKAGRFSSLPRKLLVVVQFTVSITLIIGTIIILQQVQYAKNRPVGYSRNGLISVPINTPDLRGNYDAIRNDLLQTGMVENMAESSQRITLFNNNNSLDWPGKDPSLQIFFRNVNITPDFGKTIGWTMASGRDFSRDIISDSSGIILNEEAARLINLKNPIGEVVKYRDKEYTIIGIVSNMVTQSPYDPIEPSMFFMGKGLYVITLRIKPDAPVQEALSAIEPVFKKYNPNAPFEYNFVDEEFGRKFSDEERIGNLASLFAILAVFISCLGLFGLASFVAEQRTKEIGIRKVMGASVSSVWQMLSKDFVLLVIISCVIAIPVASYSLSGWLQQYQYHTEISWWIFLLTAIGALAITLLTVSFQAVRAAVANPEESEIGVSGNRWSVIGNR
ncbi:MAG: FtsX-like permease family protein [Bacteroidota bacterium]